MFIGLQKPRHRLDGHSATTGFQKNRKTVLENHCGLFIQLQLLMLYINAPLLLFSVTVFTIEKENFITGMTILTLC